MGKAKSKSDLTETGLLMEGDSAQDPSNERNLFRWRLAQSKTLIGQVRRDGKPYPADPDWYDRAFNTDLPAAKKADGMKESH